MESLLKCIEEDIQYILNHPKIKEINYYLKKNTTIHIEYSLLFDILDELKKEKKQTVLIEERMDLLVNTLKDFDIEIDLLNNISIIWENSIKTGPLNLQLLFNLYSYLVEESIQKKLLIQEVLELSLEQLKSSIQNNIISVDIYIELKGISLENEEFKIDDNIEILKPQQFITFKKEGFEMDFLSIEPLLRYKTKDKIYFNKKTGPRHINSFYRKVTPSLINDWRLKETLINEFIFSLYLKGYSFSYKKLVSIPPWWLRNMSKSKKITVSYLGSGFSLKKPENEQRVAINYDDMIHKEDIKIIRELHNLIKRSQILRKKSFSLLIHRYFQMFEYESFQDMILNEFIILESIYTSGNKSEIIFRLSLNIAFFLEESIEKFKDTFQFINDVYSIRSKIIHGDKWKNLLNKNKIKKHFEESNNEIIARNIYIELKKIIDKTFIKIMHWEIENQKSFFESAHGLFFLENCNFLKK